MSREENLSKRNSNALIRAQGTTHDQFIGLHLHGHLHSDICLGGP